MPEKDRFLLASPTIFEIDYQGRILQNISYDSNYKTAAAEKIILNKNTIILFGRKISDMSFYGASEYSSESYFSVNKGAFKNYNVESNVSEITYGFLYFNDKIYIPISIFYNHEVVTTIKRFDSLQNAIKMKKFVNFNNMLQKISIKVVSIEVLIIILVFGSFINQRKAKKSKET